MAQTSSPVTHDPGEAYPYIHKTQVIMLFAADFEAAAQSDTVSLEELLDYTNAIKIDEVDAAIGEYFGDGGSTIDEATLDVGKNGDDTDGYLDGLNVFDTTALSTWTGTRGVLVYGQGSEEGFQSSPNIEALLTLGSGQECGDLTTGKAAIRVRYRELKR